MAEKNTEIIQLSQDFIDKIDVGAGSDGVANQQQQCLDMAGQENTDLQTAKQQVQVQQHTQGDASIPFSAPSFPGEQKIGDPNAVLDPVKAEAERRWRQKAFILLGDVLDGTVMGSKHQEFEDLFNQLISKNKEIQDRCNQLLEEKRRWT